MCVAQGRPLPDAIANAPELQQGLELYYNAFNVLTSTRQIGMAEGPIPWDKVEHYCDQYGIDGDQREDMHYHISSLDRVYLEHRAESLKRKSTSADGPKTVRPKNPYHRKRG